MDVTVQIPTTNWQALLESWDKQQTTDIKWREERFSTMIQALADHVGTQFTFVELGCGAGALTQRILETFPLATAIAVDCDPVLLALAKIALARFGDRVTLVDADMREQNWADKLPVQQVDAAVSCCTLHGLSTDDLIHVYDDMAERMPEGGMILINGDHLAYDKTERFSQRLAQAHRDRVCRRLQQSPESADRETWWKGVEREPGLQKAFAERAIRQAAATRHHGTRHASQLNSLSLHTLALRNAGCSEVTTLWQHFDSRIVMGIKGRKIQDALKPVVEHVVNYWNDPTRSQEYDTDSQHAPGFDRLQAAAAWRKEFATVLPPAPAQVLDMGCGPGFVSLNLAEMGYQVRGIDTAENMLVRARTEAQSRGLQATFELCDATNPTGQPQSYDAVVSRFLFWTLPDPMQTLKTAMGLLKPGALMAVFDGTWFSKGWKHADSVGKPWYELWNEVYNARTRNNLPLMQDNDAPKVAALLEAAGYSNVQWRMLEEVRQMNIRTMGIEHDEGEVYVVWGYAPN